MSRHRITLVGAALLLAAAGAPLVFAAEADVVGTLVDRLGISEEQARGGYGAIVEAAKGGLSGDEYSSLLGSSPGLSSLVEGMGGEAAAAAGEMMAGDAAEAAGKMMAGDAPNMSDGRANEAAAKMAESSEGAMEGMSGKMAAASEAMGDLDVSSLSNLKGLTEQFEGLGLDAGMVQKFVPVVLGQLGSGSQASGLLKKGLGLM